MDSEDENFDENNDSVATTAQNAQNGGDTNNNNNYADYNNIEIYDIINEIYTGTLGVSEVNDSFEGTGGDNIVIDLTDKQYQKIINNTEKRIGDALNSYKKKMTNELNDNNGRDSTVVSKVTKATQNSAVHSISSTIVSEFMNNKETSLDNLIGTNRNKYVLSMFDMISKGYNFNKKKIREDIAVGSNAPRSLKTNNLKQMQQCWGTKVTEHFAYTHNGGEGFCYLCSGKITPGENNFKYSPEVEHKMPCVLFYSQVYNLNHYPVLKKIWIEFIDKNNNEDVFKNMKELYSFINYENFVNGITYGEYKQELDHQYQDIYRKFKTYVEVNYKKYKTLIRDEKREQYLKEFQGLLKCYLLEFSWSHHTCNQAKTNYNFTKTEDVKSYIKNLTPIKEYNKYPRGAVMKKKFVDHEKDAIQKGFASDKNLDSIDKYTNTYVLPQITALSDSINEYANIVNLTNKRLFIRSLKRITLSSMKGGKKNENKSITNLINKEKTFSTNAKSLKGIAFGSFIVNNSNNSNKSANYDNKLTEVFNNIEKYDVYLLMTLINDILSYSNFMNVIIGLFLAVPLCIGTSTKMNTTFGNTVYNAISYKSEILEKVENFLQNNLYYDKVILLNKECKIILNNYDKNNTDKNTKIVKKFIKNIRRYVGGFNSEGINIREKVDHILPKINNQIGGKRKRRYKMRKTRRKSKVSKKKTLRFKYKI